jgi:hypothetical protein
LLIPLANLVDLQLRGSGIDWSALVWAQWVSRELMISLNLKRARKIWEKEGERLIWRGLRSDTDIKEEREISGMREGNREKGNRLYR